MFPSLGKNITLGSTSAAASTERGLGHVAWSGLAQASALELGSPAVSSVPQAAVLRLRPRH